MEHKSRRPVDWEAFVLRYETKLYRTALAILGDAQEAEDAVQDTFLRYLEKAPVFSCPAQEAAWMTRVTVNRCISLLRSPGAAGWSRCLRSCRLGKPRLGSWRSCTAFRLRTGPPYIYIITRAIPQEKWPPSWACPPARSAPVWPGPERS